jgi:hypothetical protein
VRTALAAGVHVVGAVGEDGLGQVRGVAPPERPAAREAVAPDAAARGLDRREQLGDAQVGVGGDRLCEWLRVSPAT